MKKKICLLLCAFSFVFAFNAHAFEKGSGWYVAPKLMPTGALTSYDEYNTFYGSSLLYTNSEAPTGISFGIAVGKDFSKTGFNNINLELEYFHSSLDIIGSYLTYSDVYTQRIEAFFTNIYYNMPFNYNFFFTTSLSLGLAMHGVNIECLGTQLYNDKLKPAFLMGLGCGFLYNINENWGIDLHTRFFTIFGGGSGTDIFGDGYYLSSVSIPFQGVLGVRYYF